VYKNCIFCRCDGHKDCPLGDDEICEVGNCRDDQFKCANEQCIPIQKRCDYMHDCADGSDEVNCKNTCKGKINAFGTFDS